MNFKPIAKVNNVEKEWSVGDYTHDYVLQDRLGHMWFCSEDNDYTISDLENIISFMKEQHRLYAYQSNNS